MQLNSAFFDDLAKMASGAAGAALDLKREIESAVAAKVDNFLANHNLVRRDEFEAVKAMAAKAREQNEELTKRLAEIELRLEKFAQK